MTFPRTPFIDRLNSFYCPNDDELSTLQTLLPGPRAQLLQIEGEIAHTTKILDDLKERRYALRRYIFSHESLLAPIRRLPPYLLQEIFLTCLPTEHNAVFDAAAAPLLFGRVCRYWRRLSQDTPLLWSRFLVSGDSNSLYYPRYDTLRSTAPPFSAQLNRWLGFSRESPIHISYIQQDVVVGRQEEDTPLFAGRKPDFNSTMLPVLLDVRSRIQSLDAWNCNVTFFHSLLSQIPDEMPLLKHVRFICDTYGPQPLFENATLLRHPNLETVSLVGPSGSPLMIPLPWNNLSELQLLCHPLNDDTLEGGVNLNDVHQILHWCPQLIRCNIAVTRLGLLTHSSPVTLLSLKELFLCSMRYYQPSSTPTIFEIEPLLHLLIMPKLQAFGAGVSIIHKLSPQYLAAPGEQVAEFDVDSISITTILGVLRELPQTTTLRLIGREGESYGGWGRRWPLDGTFFEAVERENLGSLLRHLYLELMPMSSDLAASRLVPFLYSCPSTLQTITLRVPTADPDTPLPIRDELQELENRGITVHLRYALPQASQARMFSHDWYDDFGDRHSEEDIDLAYQLEDD
ncbi:WD40 repeat-like protein [Mycena indigotica]|uniref:WD40 repeat-like protein n=1 Tax=Mycena indigotica TaxID=2126181 RepID=A0A8H6SGY6_9AGAR|nr:WD40 repeat-like protein [Mycena indigotica]KAF7298702.1 WD40 repeat-like protein [Mycena indigotica]